MFTTLLTIAAFGCILAAVEQIQKHTLRGYLFAAFDMALAGLFIYLTTKL